MYARVRFLGHPVHQMMVVLPLGLWISAVAFDLINLVSGNDTFAEVAYWNLVAGSVTAAVTALIGLIDWTGIPSGTRAKTVGLIHAGANSVALVLFVIAWLIRIDNTHHVAGGGVFALEAIALAVGGVGGWLGGELVNRHGIGVYEQASPDATSSLSSTV